MDGLRMNRATCMAEVANAMAAADIALFPFARKERKLSNKPHRMGKGVPSPMLLPYKQRTPEQEDSPGDAAANQPADGSKHNAEERMKKERALHVMYEKDGEVSFSAAMKVINSTGALKKEIELMATPRPIVEKHETYTPDRCADHWRPDRGDHPLVPLASS